MNPPIRNISFERPDDTIHKSKTQLTLGVSGLTNRKNIDLPAINSSGFDITILRYFSKNAFFGISVSMFEPYEGLIPTYNNLRISDVMIEYIWPITTYLAPMQSLFKNTVTVGYNIFGISLPFIIGGGTFITTVHLPAHIDIFFNMHANITLFYMVHWKTEKYNLFRDFDVGMKHSILLKKIDKRIFYSVSFQRFRGIRRLYGTIHPDYPVQNIQNDFRVGFRIGITLF